MIMSEFDIIKMFCLLAVVEELSVSLH